MAKTKKKNYTLVILFVLLIGISVGYAAFAQTLTIIGTASANGNFRLEFTDAIIDPSYGAEGSTVTPSGESLKINMNLEYPGAGAVITATITNTGSIAAELEDIKLTGTEDKDILVSFDYPELKTVIEPGEKEQVLINVKWADDSKIAKEIPFTATLDYKQSTESFTVPEEPQA